MEKKYCAAPWRGVHINFRGDVKTCCAGDPNMLGKITDSPIEDILTSAILQEIRTSIKNGKLHTEYCSNCIDSEIYGSSERHWHNDVNDDFDIDKVSATTTHRPVIFDVRWNNTCNLSCNYCMPYCSTKWANILGEYSNTDIKEYYKNIVDYMQRNQDYVKEVAMVGGEPLLLKENEFLLDVLPSKTLVTLITNLSLDLNKNKIAQKLFQRNRVGWSMSFDNIDKRFEYVRAGASWKQLDTNVKVIKSMFAKGHHGGIHAVYNLYNCTRLCELKEYANSVGHSILWQTLFQPEWLDPSLFNSKVRQLAVDEINKLMNDFNLDPQEENFFNLVKDNMTNKISSDRDIATEFWKQTEKLETVYHPNKESFRDLWPELAAVI